MLINKAQNAAEAAVLKATKDVKQATVDSFGAKWDVLGLFGTGASDSPTGLSNAKQALAKAYTGFLESNPAPDRKEAVDAWVAKVAPDVQKSVEWYVRTH